MDGSDTQCTASIGDIVVFIAMPFFGVKDRGNKLLEAEDEIGGKLEADGIHHQIIHLSPEATIPQNNFTIKYNKDSRVGKGTCVSHALNLAKIKHQKYYPKMQAYFICCDGSGKIPFKYVIEVVRALQSMQYNCILAKRGIEKAISEERYAIERFELFLLTNGDKIIMNNLDGQCGLWGFNMSECSEIELKSEGYELELEFLSKILSSEKTKIGTIRIDVVPGPTNFDGSQHYKKLIFLADKCSLNREDITKKVENFEENFNIKLPMEYMEMIKRMSPQKPKILEKEIDQIKPTV